jgi:hypothetical protein
MAASMKIPVFWNTATCSLVEVKRYFRGTLYLPKYRGVGSQKTFLLSLDLLNVVAYYFPIHVMAPRKSPLLQAAPSRHWVWHASFRLKFTYINTLLLNASLRFLIL